MTKPMLDRRSLLSLGLGAGAALSLPRGVFAAPDKTFKILMLTFRGETEVERGFRDLLDSAGLKTEIVSRDCKRDITNLPGLIADLDTLKPDLIYTWGTPVTLGVVGPYDSADPKFIRNIPVVFALVAAPVQARIAPSLAEPGRNVTGSVHVVPTDVQMKAMQSFMDFSTVGILYSTSEQNSDVIVREVKTFCDGIGAKVLARPFKNDANGRPTAEGVEEMVRQLRTDKADWLYLLPDTFLGTIYDRVTPAAAAAGLPTFGAAELAIREGGALVGLVSRYYSVGQLAGTKAVEILVNGRAPGTIPIETLKRFSLIINMRIAKSLGIYPPIAMLNYAELVTG
ncbi:peptide ABC transporter substrate-binding protein [Azorhizobium oxalatiphilum]|uniref:Peptide ABC transporter substrate-binding protein n=1 Tax=Azorhizobium oxalatiphilum TaxID=980631 RepID=A0A917CJ41_9HYPH|nr:ABC transporter substrate-binding protein [Azorhizobium oxalatiphilum]GGF89269.1 peptide ABC transporter substrate-binding protein [Azorhizobium oxalatiphilum]